MVETHIQDGKRKDSKGSPLQRTLKGTRKTGCQLLRFKDVCKSDMRSAAIDTESWELMVKDRSTWRHLVKEGIKHAENTRNMRQVEKRNISKAMGTVTLPNTNFKCERCDKDCH